MLKPNSVSQMLMAFCLFLASCEVAPTSAQTAARRPSPVGSASLPTLGGQQVIVLHRQRSGDGNNPEFLSVTLLPGRGMNVFQITAFLPGKGEVPLLVSPSLTDAAKLLSGKSADADGNESFMMGGAFLFPFANRILGPTTPDGRYVRATWHGRTVLLRANWHGSRPGSAPQALHGQLLTAKAASIQNIALPDGAAISATYHLPADGHWFSDNELRVRVALRAETLTFTLVGTNTGQQEEPVGFGWHPYFRLPSGERANARLHIPAYARAAVNNPDDMFPTGKLLPVQGTPYDFTADVGSPLTGTVNDAFLQLHRTKQGYTICRIMDVGADYGLEIAALTPLVRTILLYSPVDQPLIVLEPQFNNGDPFGREWRNTGNGMVTVPPGGRVTWKARLRLFQPDSKTGMKVN